jgi:hypothetical protein
VGDFLKLQKAFNPKKGIKPHHEFFFLLFEILFFCANGVNWLKIRLYFAT